MQHDENVSELIDELDEATDQELGIVTEDPFSKERRYFIHGRGSIWISYVLRVDVYDTLPTEDVLDTIRVLGGDHAVIPVEGMPVWGDSSLQAQDLFSARR